MDCLTRRFQDPKCKDDKSEKIEQKFDLHNRKGSTKEKLFPKEETPSKIESKGTAVKIESPGEQQEKIYISASGSQKELGKSPDPENEDNQKSAFMISGNSFELSFRKKYFESSWIECYRYYYSNFYFKNVCLNG